MSTTEPPDWYKTIDAEAVKRRLEAHTVRVGECWFWTGDAVAGGYGRIHIGPTKVLVHRVSYALEHGPTSLFVLHACDNPPCWNPAHLWAGTHAENMADRNAKGRQSRGEAVRERARLQMQRQARVTEAMVADVFARRATGASQLSIAKAVGVSQMTVSRILNHEPTVAVRRGA